MPFKEIIAVCSEKSNVVFQWLTLVRIPEVPGSNPGQEADYPDQSFSYFSSVTQDKCIIVPKN
jgi:hypothetical protein